MQLTSCFSYRIALFLFVFTLLVDQKLITSLKQKEKKHLLNYKWNPTDKNSIYRPILSHMKQTLVLRSNNLSPY